MVYVFVFVCICLFQRNMFAESCVYTPCFRPPNYSPSLFLSPLYVYIYIYMCVCIYIHIYICVCVCVRFVYWNLQCGVVQYRFVRLTVCSENCVYSLLYMNVLGYISTEVCMLRLVVCH